MATRLKNIIGFVAVPPAVPTSLPHGLNIDLMGVVPDFLGFSSGDFSFVGADATNVTVLNTTGLPASLDVLCEHWHSFERAFGAESVTNLSPQPFVLIPGTGGSGTNTRDWKDSCRAATVGDIVLAGLQIIDTVVLVAGDRVLVKNQIMAALNGLYVVGPGPWSRAPDADQSSEVTAGLAVFVTEGTLAQADTAWELVTDDPIVLGVTPLTFVRFTGLTIQDEGVTLATRPTLNFVGGGVSAVDNPGMNRVDVTIPNAAAVSGWTDSGAIVHLTTGTDTVAIGTTTMFGAEKLRVVGDVRIEGKLTVTGDIDPTRVLLSGVDKRFGATDVGTVYIAPFGDAITAVQVRKADNVTVVLDVDTTNGRVGIGTSAPDSTLHVVGAAHITGKLTVDGAIDPTSITLVDAGNAAYIENAAGQTAAVSPANRGRFRYNATTNKWQLSENGGAYTDVSGGGGVTLDGAYDFGGAGAGRTITVDAGSVTMTNSAADNNDVLAITKSPAALQGGDGIMVSMSNSSGHGINVSNAGSGAGVSILASSTGGGLSVTHTGSAVAVGITNTGTSRAFSVTHNTGTGIDAVLVVRAPAVIASGNAVLLQMGTGAGSASGNALGITMGTNATGSAIFITDANTTNANALVNITRSAGATGPMILLTKNPAVSNAGIPLSLAINGMTGTAGIDIQHTGTLGFGGSGINIGSTNSTLSNGIKIDRSPTAVAGGIGLLVNMGANASGIGVSIVTNAGTGNAFSIDHTGSGKTVNVITQAGSGVSSILYQTNVVAGGGTYYSIFGNEITGDLLLLNKVPAGPTVRAGDLLKLVASAFSSGVGVSIPSWLSSGHAVSITNNATTVAHSLNISQANTGGGSAINVSQAGSGTGLAMTVTTNTTAKGISVTDTVVTGTTDLVVIDAATTRTGKSLSVKRSGTALVELDNNITAGETAMLLAIAGGATQRVSVGANDSGGAGFRLLRVPN